MKIFNTLLGIFSRKILKMSSKLYYKSGSWNIICDVCGKKIKAHEAKHRWDGLLVWDNDFEHRHPQDFIRARQDKISVPYTRPRPTDVFVSYCSSWGVNGAAGVGTADCAQADIDNGLREWTLRDK